MVMIFIEIMKNRQNLWNKKSRILYFCTYLFWKIYAVVSSITYPLKLFYLFIYSMSYFNFKPVWSKKHEQYFIVIILGFLFGIFTISFMLWNKLIRVRLPRELHQLEYSHTYFRFWIVLELSIIFWLITLVVVWRFIKELRQNTKAHPLLIRLGENLKEYFKKNKKLVFLYKFWIYYVLDAPTFIWLFLLRQSPKFSRLAGKFLLTRCCLYLATLYPPRNEDNEELNQNFRTKQELTIIICNFLPRIIIVIVLLYEVIINKKIQIFYAILPLWIIPTAFKTFLSLVSYTRDIESVYILKELKDFGVLAYEEDERNKEEIKKLKGDDFETLFFCTKDEYLAAQSKDWFTQGKELSGVLSLKDDSHVHWLLINDVSPSILRNKEVNELITLYWKESSAEDFADRFESFAENCKNFSQQYAKKAMEVEDAEDKVYFQQVSKRLKYRFYIFQYLLFIIRYTLYALSYSIWICIYLGIC
jgi:hypothetical protein